MGRKRKISKQTSVIIELETSELEMKKLDEDENLKKEEKEELHYKSFESILEEDVDVEVDVEQEVLDDQEELDDQEGHDEVENESSVNDEETQEAEQENDERRPLFKESMQ